ncbi:hypothetical protein JL722_4007 [Aureococcus anophagefferens]|nr:hypothetical protein JL722_4007 [Aureococcus anophagefferens]
MKTKVSSKKASCRVKPRLRGLPSSDAVDPPAWARRSSPRLSDAPRGRPHRGARRASAAMVLVERRLFAARARGGTRVLHQIARTGQYPQQRYVDISDSDSDNDYDLELALPVEPYRSSNPIHWLEGQVDEMINSTVSRNSDLPAYPIMRYALNLDLQYETDGKQTIANALAFRDEFAAMLQRGFRVIKHAPHHKPKTHKLWLSEDGAYVWWQPALDAGPPAAQFLVSDIHIIPYPPEPRRDRAHPSCFMLVFDLGQTAGDAEIRRRMVVFETVNVETKHLVDGFRLLKGTATAAADAAGDGNARDDASS